MITTFPKIIKKLLANLPQHDYPVLHTQLFMSLWLGFVLDQSLASMRDLIKRANIGGINIDLSTFSKANTHRSVKPFMDLYHQVLQLVKNRKGHQGGKGALSNYEICPIDSTIITLTSKLMWNLGYHQVKLIDIFNNKDHAGQNPLIHFGQDHDYKFSSKMTDTLSQNQVGVMDRGFGSLEYLQELQANDKYFVIRLSSNYKIEASDNGLYQVGTGKNQGLYRVVQFCSLEDQSEYRIATNLSSEISNGEISDIYRMRWGIELFWKFLKMHLKLDQLITKNVNGITIQIYSALIGYLILELVEIPQMFGEKLLDKLRYLQACVSQECSYMHWISRILDNRPQRLNIVH